MSSIRCRSRALSLGLVALCWLVPSRPAGAVEQFGTSFDGLGHLPASTRNLLILPDLLPHLRSAVRSPVLHRVLTDEALVRALAALAPNLPHFDAAALERELAKAEPYLPVELAVATPEGTWSELGRWARVGLLIGLCNGAVAAGREAVLGELPGLQEQLLAELRALRLPETSVWLRLRRAEEADALFRKAAEGAPILNLFGGQVSADPERIRVQFAVGKLLAAVQVQLQWAELGVVLNDSDPKAAALTEAVAALRLEIELRRYPEGLLLSVASPALGPGAGGFARERLGPLWQPDERLLLFARWDLEGLHRETEAALALWQRWAPTPVGRKTAELDREGLLLDLQQFARQVRRSGTSGSMIVVTSPRLEMLSLEEGAPPATELRGSSLLQHVPADLRLVRLDATVSLANAWADALAQFEERLASQSLKAELGDNETKQQILDAVDAFYYGRLGGLRRLIFEEAFEVFEPPLASVEDVRGALAELRVGFESPAGQRNELVLRQQKLIEFAVLAKPRQVPAGLDFLARLQGVVRAALRGGDTSASPPAAPLQPLELGLGVPTYGFDLSGGQPLPARASVSVSGDLHPHVFVSGELLVLSSSPRLSRAILAAARGQAPRLAPDASGEDRLVAYWHFEGTEIGRMLDIAGQWVAAVAGDGPEASLSGPRLELGDATRLKIGQIGQLVRAASGVAGLVEKVGLTASEDGSVRRVRVWIDLAAP